MLYAIELTNEGQHILAAGPHTRQPNTIEYRIVLIRHFDESFSVHSQIFEGPHTHYLISGVYFDKGREGFEKACRAFGETVAKQAWYYSSALPSAAKGVVGTTYRTNIFNMEKTDEVSHHQ